MTTIEQMIHNSKPQFALKGQARDLVSVHIKFFSSKSDEGLTYAEASFERSYVEAYK